MLLEPVTTTTTTTTTTADVLEVLGRVAAYCDEAPAEPWQDLELELQESLFESGGRYSPPDAEHLAALARPIVKRRKSPKFDTAHAGLPDAVLLDRVPFVHHHRGRGVSTTDWSLQRELVARAAGVGWVRSLTCVELPRVYGDPGLHRGVARGRILRALQVADAQGWLGLYGSGERLAAALDVNTATWWRAVAWLEKRGWIIRLRTYKSGKHSGTPIDLSRNWYGPGPKLVRWRDVYRSEIAGDRALFVSAARAVRVSWIREEASSCVAPVVAGLAAITAGKAAAYDAELDARARRARTGGGWEPMDSAELVAAEGVELEAEALAALPGQLVELATMNRRAALASSPLVVMAARTYSAASVEPAPLYGVAKCVKTPQGVETHELDRSPLRSPSAAAGSAATGSWCGCDDSENATNHRDEGGDLTPLEQKLLGAWLAATHGRARASLE